MYDTVYFYLHYGNGDIYESREFVKEWMEKVPANKYCYAHGKHPKILWDMPKLQSVQVTPEMDMYKDVYEIDNNLYINCWIGRNSKYVLPGIGCVVEKIYEMHNDMMAKLGVGRLTKPVLDYIPSIDYSYYDVFNVDKFIKEFTGRKVLIDNGNVQSNQAKNFDFTPIILRLTDYYPDITFITTHKITNTKPNLFSTEEIIKSVEPFDLNEISYLSLFCDTIIGRNSGPNVFAQVKENWMNPDKVFMSFTYTKIAATFVLSNEVKAKKYWSDFISEDGVYYKCIEAIERK